MKRVRDFHSQSWNNPFFARQASIGRFKIILISIVLLLLLIGLVYIFVYSSLLRNKSIEITGNETVSTEDVYCVVSDELNGYSNLILPKDNYSIIDPKTIQRVLAARFLNFRNVKVEKKINKLIIEIEERKPTFRLIVTDKSYLLDQEGIGIREAVPGEGDGLIAISQDDLSFSVGIKVLPDDWPQALLNLHSYFATLTGVRDQIIRLVPIDGSVQVVTDEGWYVIINPLSDIKSQLSSLSSALLGKFNSAERNKLLYIDVRLGDRIFYKWK